MEEELREHEENSGDLLIEYGLPDAPRKHLIVLKSGAMEIQDSEKQSSDRIRTIGRDAIESVWEMKKRTIK